MRATQTLPFGLFNVFVVVVRFLLTELVFLMQTNFFLCTAVTDIYTVHNVG